MKIDRPASSVGLAAVQLGYSRLDLEDLNAVAWTTKGGGAGQFVGQHQGARVKLTTGLDFG